MSIGTAYQVVKDVANWVVEKEGEPIRIGRSDADTQTLRGLGPTSKTDDLAWCPPSKLFARTTGKVPECEIVWLHKSNPSRRHRFVHLNRAGELETLVRRLRPKNS